MSKKRDKSRSKNHTSKNDKGAKKRPEPSDHRKRPRLVEGEERKVHEEIIERRLGGGAPPTEEAYARALKQWEELPGSVVRPPTDVKLPTQKPTKSQNTLNASEQTNNGTDKGNRSS